MGRRASRQRRERRPEVRGRIAPRAGTRPLAAHPGRLLTLTGAGYALNVLPESLDTQVFEERVKAAQAVRDATRAEAMLREALAMWRGPALAG